MLTPHTLYRRTINIEAHNAALAGELIAVIFVMRSKISCSQCKEVFDVPVDGFPCHSFAKRRAISRAREV